METEFMEVS